MAHTPSNDLPTHVPLFPDLIEHAKADNTGRILGTPDAREYFEALNARKSREDVVTLQSLYHFSSLEAAPFIARISPRPVLIVNAKGDAAFPPMEIKAAYDKAGEPKECWEFDGGHCDAYCGPLTQSVMVREAEFMKKYL